MTDTKQPSQPKKMHFFQDKVQHLGYTVSKEGISTSEDKVKVFKIDRFLKHTRNSEHFMDSQVTIADLCQSMHMLQSHYNVDS